MGGVRSCTIMLSISFKLITNQRRLMETLIFSHVTCKNVVVCKFTPNQNVWQILVVNFYTILCTEFNEFSMNRKVLQSRLQICDLPDPTHGSLSCYGQESSEDSQQWKTLQLLLVQAISLLASLLQTSWSKFVAFKNGEQRDSSIVTCKTQFTADETWN